MKKTLALIAGTLLLSAPAMAAEIPQVATQAPAYNCDYEPSCEVAPGAYGKMSSPVTSKFNLSIGGFARLDYAYNSQNLGDNGFVLPATLPRSGSAKSDEDQSQFSAKVSRFWLKVGGPTFLGAKTNALIEADFMGVGGTTATNETSILRMRHAYGTIDWPNTQIMFGQFWDIFGPAAASTIDFNQGAAWGTPNNPRVAQFRITQKVNFNSDNFLKIVLGVQNPSQNQSSVNGTGGNVPNVAGQIMFVSKALGVGPGFYGMSMNSLTAGFFGLWGNQSSHHKSTDVYGYGAYAFVPLLKSKDGKSRAMTASLEAQAYIASGMNWNGATAPVPVPTGGTNNLINGKANKGYGAYGQIIFYPVQNLGFTAGYERRNAIDYESTFDTGSNAIEEYKQLIYANVAYDLNAAVRVSAEYLHAKEQFHGPVTVAGPTLGEGDSGNNNGVRVAMYYFF